MVDRVVSSRSHRYVISGSENQRLVPFAQEQHIIGSVHGTAPLCALADTVPKGLRSAPIIRVRSYLMLTERNTTLCAVWLLLGLFKVESSFRHHVRKACSQALPHDVQYLHATVFLSLTACAPYLENSSVLFHKTQLQNHSRVC